MKKIFYQFEVFDQGGSRTRVSVVTSGDEDTVRDWLCDKRFGGLKSGDIALCPCVVHFLPDTMAIEPVDAGKMTCAWSSWRVTDYVYGLSDEADVCVRAKADGVIATHDGDHGAADVRLAVARALTYGERSTLELVNILARAGVRFARARTHWALFTLARAGRVAHVAGRWRAEVRRP